MGAFECAICMSEYMAPVTALCGWREGCRSRQCEALKILRSYTLYASLAHCCTPSLTGLHVAVHTLEMRLILWLPKSAT